jgi:hypothetical protein
MSSMPARDTAQRRRSRLFDPRLVLGIALIVGSIVGVVALVSALDRTITVYSAPDTLISGDRVTAGDLVEEKVRLGSLEKHYLLAGEIPAEGLVVTRTVADGELVPASAVGGEASMRSASVVVTIRGQLPRSVGAGTVVDLWAARAGDGGEFGPPSVVADSAVVVRVVEQQGVIAGGDAITVELLVPRERTARILEAKANDDALSLVSAAVAGR